MSEVQELSMGRAFYEYFCARLAKAYERRPFFRPKDKDLPKAWDFLTPAEQEAWQWYVEEFGGIK